jgi:hypothetical protein
MSGQLVGELFDGPIDCVGDVHGEIDALFVLLERLGYDSVGRHPEGRRLVFVGDLVDRGPDSPGVANWVQARIAEGRAQCVLGNHEFNALRASTSSHPRDMKTELSWLYDEARPYTHSYIDPHTHARVSVLVPQKRVTHRQREELLAFFRSLPLALERGGELPVRVVHACWQPGMIERLRHRHDVLLVHEQEHRLIEESLAAGRLGEDRVIRNLLHQNLNAVKRITSGLEARLDEPIEIGGKLRWEGRAPWWQDYHDPVLVVVGHYWRLLLPGEKEKLFDGVPIHGLLGRGNVMCIDYSVGKRYRERIDHDRHRDFATRLAALRLPEKVLYFDEHPPLPCT